jgi:predicted restriction endonuclease
VKVRIGQDLYRGNLDTYWKGCCAVSGLSVRQALRASHAKPWALCSTDAERLSVFNGFLLSANLDALFDKGLISFDDAGRAMVSKEVEPTQWKVLGLDSSTQLRWIADRHKPFLDWHRKNLFKG